MKLLVVASTFPAHEADTVPAFVRDQISAMKQVDATLDIRVLAPHDARSGTSDHTRHPDYDEHRFHYAWPRTSERLAGHGIMPALRENRMMYLWIIPLFISEFVALLRLTRRWGPDVIYAHWFTPQGVVACWVSRLTGTPFVFTTHASDVAVWAKIPYVGPWIVRSHVRRARRFTAVSRRSMDKLAGFFSTDAWSRLQQRSALIPMGVPVSNRMEDTEDQAADPARVLFVGRLVEKKGVQYLLDAWADVHRDNPTARLTIVGDGPMRADLERRAAELGLEPGSVEFTGYLTGADKERVFAEHGVFVVPSIVTDSGDAEGLPVSLMEGLASSKVCVATAESGADDFLDDGENGFLIGQRDVPGLSAALTRALRLSADERGRVGAAARRTAVQFDWPAVAGRHLDFLFSEGP